MSRSSSRNCNQVVQGGQDTDSAAHQRPSGDPHPRSLNASQILPSRTIKPHQNPLFALSQDRKNLHSLSQTGERKQQQMDQNRIRDHLQCDRSVRPRRNRKQHCAWCWASGWSGSKLQTQTLSYYIKTNEEKKGKQRAFSPASRESPIAVSAQLHHPIANWKTKEPSFPTKSRSVDA